MMKCDTCHWKTGYILGPDECGAGNLFEYCAKDHWDDSGPRDEEEDRFFKSSTDPWTNCKDYKEK